MPFLSRVSGIYGPLGKRYNKFNFSAATGGTYTTFTSGGNLYARHTFLATGAVQYFTPTKVEGTFGIWLWGAGGGGGGGGGGFLGGPGGGGGYIARPTYTLTQGVQYEIVVGIGGYGGAAWNGGYAWNGGCSSIDTNPTDGGTGAPNAGLGAVLLGAGGGNGGRPHGAPYGAATAGVPNPEGNGLTSGYSWYSGDYSSQAVSRGLSSSTGVSYGNASGDGAQGGNGAVVIEYQIG